MTSTFCDVITETTLSSAFLASRGTVHQNTQACIVLLVGYHKPWETVWCGKFIFCYFLSFEFSVDIWSIGCIFGELIRGSVLFPGGDRILFKLMSRAPLYPLYPPMSSGCFLPRDLRDLVVLAVLYQSISDTWKWIVCNTILRLPCFSLLCFHSDLCYFDSRRINCRRLWIQFKKKKEKHFSIVMLFKTENVVVYLSVCHCIVSVIFKAD